MQSTRKSTDVAWEQNPLAAVFPFSCSADRKPFCLVLDYDFINVNIYFKTEIILIYNHLCTCKHVNTNKSEATIRCVCTLLNILFFFFNYGDAAGGWYT